MNDDNTPTGVVETKPTTRRRAKVQEAVQEPAEDLGDLRTFGLFQFHVRG